MKIAYIIFGLPCTGKSTFADILGKELNIKVFHCEKVYKEIVDRYKIPEKKMIYFPFVNYWDDFDLKPKVEEIYKEWFKDLPDTIILESYNIIFNHQENRLVKELLKDYEFRYFMIRPKYEQWLRNRSKRMVEDPKTVPSFMEETDYVNQCETLKRKIETNTIFDIYDIYDVKRTYDFELNYQSEKLNEPKWNIFDFPEDMRGKKFFEIGCNEGYYLKKAKNIGAKVFGIDIDWRLLDKVLDKVPDATLWISKIEEFPIVGHFDYILCASMFQYCINRESVIQKLSMMTNNLTLELPLLEIDKMEIKHQGIEGKTQCSLVSRKLLYYWLLKYFKEVNQIGETVMLDGVKRPVFRCTK